MGEIGNNFKAQGAIEYLLIIGAAILVVAIVILAVTGVLSGGQSQTSVGVTSVNDSFDTLKESSNNFIKVDGQYYTKSDPILVGLSDLWHLNDSNADAISSGKGLTFVSTPNVFEYSDGLFGSGISSNGGTQSPIASALGVGVDSSKGFTISAWIKGAPYSTQGTTVCDAGIVSSESANVYYTPRQAWSLSMCIYGRTNKAVIFATDGSITYGKPQLIISSKSDVRNNNWHSVVMTLSTDPANSFARLYVDGNLEASDIPKNIFPGHVKTSNVYVGTSQSNGVSKFVGEIDELKIWNRALTDAEIKTLFVNATKGAS
ncbi:MAG: LamG-like jellyroll fold domain-containing protein [archaeon]